MKRILIFLLGSFIVISCKKEQSGGHEYHEPPAPYHGPGDCKGNVTQYNQFGEKIISPLNNVTVSIAGTSYSTTTDANGNYTLSNIPEGTYDFLFSRTGCGTWVAPGMGFGLLKAFSVEIPTYSFSAISLRDTTIINNWGPKLWMSGTLTPVNKSTGLVVICSTTGSPDINVPSTFKVVGRYNIPPNTTTVGAIIKDIPTGTPFYYKVYAHSPTAMGMIFDSSAVYFNTTGWPCVPSHGAEVPGTFTVTGH